MRRWAISVAALLCVALAGAQTVRGFARAYGPGGDLRISRPELLWEVWGADGAAVTRVEVTVNGRPVPANYDRVRRLVRVPLGPLLPGRYRVACRAVIEDVLEFRRDWEFRVRDDAMAEVPTPAPASAGVLDLANRYRRALGLPDMTTDARLVAAAQAHVDYLARNRTSGHGQSPELPGFLGDTPDARMQAFGYVGDSWECVGVGTRGADAAMRTIFDAPYHRIPFLQPGSVRFGGAFDGVRMSLNFGGTGVSGLVAWPFDGQGDVPTSWSMPDNYRFSGLDRTCGYPVVVALFGPGNPRLRGFSAELRDADGALVPVVLRTPDNDPKLSNAAVVLPVRRLSPGTSYRLSLRWNGGERQIAYRTAP